MLCRISVTVSYGDIIPAEKPTAERALPLENSGITAPEKTSIIQVIDPIQGGSEPSAETDLPRI